MRAWRSLVEISVCDVMRYSNVKMLTMNARTPRRNRCFTTNSCYDGHVRRCLAPSKRVRIT